MDENEPSEISEDNDYTHLLDETDDFPDVDDAELEADAQLPPGDAEGLEGLPA